MTYFEVFKEIDVQVAKANSLRGALFRLQKVLGNKICAQIAYTFLLHRNSYIRGDEVSGTTMPESVTQYYWMNGGTNTDPVVETIPKLRMPMYMNLYDYYTNKSTIYYNNSYLLAIHDEGWESMMICPVISNDGAAGFSAITLLGVPSTPFYDREFYMNFPRRFHQALKSNGLLQQYFKITDREKLVLECMAVGKTTADIALEVGRKQRAIELRLQNARKKLRARTTTEAVYKAAAYSIIFTQD